ncbi:MAG TPA: BON domain-containing protein, partial [Gaiellaceae bacterium]|nr:BON domain-containing protein [Gaiellaceae bacterium]
MRKLTFLAGLTAGLMYFFDRDQGNRRRAVAKDRIAAFGRRLVRRGESAGGGAASQAQALKAKATHLREEPKELDDVTLARKVESEIFRDADAPKGRVSVNVANGVVQLRGEVERPDL